MGVTTRGLTETQQRLQGIAERMRNLTPAMEVAGADTVALVDDAFRDESSPDGSPWAPLSPVTLSRRRGTTASILTNTSRLRSSITFRAGPRSMRFGTNVAYAGPNQFGASIRPWGRGEPRPLPARPFLPVARTGNGLQLMTGGRAGEHWDRIRETVRNYVTTGELR